MKSHLLNQKVLATGYIFLLFCYPEPLSLFLYSETKEEKQAVLISAEEFKKQIQEVFK